ncbi:MAG TPA: hypothetical protein VME20_11615 [Acidimicrobiales bacterium]|nr:hypothetical protein [Acidimicrobiales bacterium]
MTAAPAARPGTEGDERVLALREEGRSFAVISRALGLDGTTQAYAAFQRALRRLPAAEQESVRSHEMARLDALGEGLRQREDLGEEELAREMRSLERLRQTLLSP